jgi:hypothetical protein
MAFGEGADVIEDTEVDAMDDGVRPPSPVSGRPQAVLVPGGSFEQADEADVGPLFWRLRSQMGKPLQNGQAEAPVHS